MKVSVSRYSNFAIVLLGYFLAAVLLLHFIKPDYDPLTRFLSEYAVGQFGYIMISAFFALSLASFCLIRAVRQAVAESRARNISLRLLTVWSFGVLLAGIFVTDLSTESKTLVGMAHDISALLAFLTAPVTAILLAFAFKADEQWQLSFWPALTFGGGVVIGLVIFFSAFATATVGLNQRIYVGLILLWLIYVALNLRFGS